MNKKLKLATLMLATGVMTTGLISGTAFAQDSSTLSVEETEKSETSDLAKEGVENDALLSDSETVGLDNDPVALENPNSATTYPDGDETDIEDETDLEDESGTDQNPEIETAILCPEGTKALSDGTCMIKGAFKPE